MENNKPIRLGVDLDEVVFEYIDGLRQYLRSKDMEAPDADPVDYNLGQAGWFDTYEDFKRIHGQAVDEEIYANLNPIPDSIKTLWDLSRSGYEINIVTKRFVNPGQHKKVVKQTAESLDKHRIPHSNLLFLSDKTQFLVDCNIDDSPNNIRDLKNANRFAIIFDFAYNQNMNGPRAKNWVELREILRDKFGR